MLALLRPLLAFLAGPIGTLASAGFGITVLVLAYHNHNASQQRIGADKAVVRQEKANVEAQRRAAAAAAKSVDPAAGGLLNPHYRKD